MFFRNYKIIQIVCWLNMASCLDLPLHETPIQVINEGAASDIFQILKTKEYLPSEHYLPKSTVLNVDNDSTYILSKLSDEELIKLLNQQPKRNEYDLNDLVNLATSTKESKGFHSSGTLKKNELPKAFFKLDDKEVEPFNYNDNADPKYNAYQKLSNLLYSRPQDTEEDDTKNEILFEVLVAQLKALCCKKNKPRTNAMYKLKSLLKNVVTQKKTAGHDKSETTGKLKEHLFLIINDEIKSSNVSDELMAVDPDSLAKNSSVLLLGPIATPLSDVQLKLVMSRIGNELSKPEYLPLLHKIAEGGFSDSNVGLMKSIITAPDSRRYIKPHRCNHQSKLARIYGGPKWLICTGYLNINAPSVYD